MTETQTGRVRVYLRIGLSVRARDYHIDRRGLHHEFEEGDSEAMNPKGQWPAGLGDNTFYKEGVDPRGILEALKNHGLLLTKIYIVIPSSLKPTKSLACLVAVFTDQPGEEPLEDHRKALAELMSGIFQNFEVCTALTDSGEIEWITLSRRDDDLPGSMRPIFQNNSWTISPKVSEVRTLADRRRAMTA